jgi:carbon storage regulator
MLVLSRKPGEKVRISTDITIIVLEVKGKRVRIGIEAPRQVGIVRQELWDPALGCAAHEPHTAEGLLHAAGNP